MKKFGKLKMLTIASLSAIALAASIGVAQSVKTDQDKGQGARHEWRGRGERRDHGFGEMRGAFPKQLNLTDDQKAKMKQIRESFAERNKPLQEQLRAKRQELRQANEGGTFNEALVTQKLTEMAGLQAKLMGEEFKLRDGQSFLFPGDLHAKAEALSQSSRPEAC